MNPYEPPETTDQLSNHEGDPDPGRDRFVGCLTKLTHAMIGALIGGIVGSIADDLRIEYLILGGIFGTLHGENVVNWLQSK